MSPRELQEIREAAAILRKRCGAPEITIRPRPPLKALSPQTAPHVLRAYRRMRKEAAAAGVILNLPDVTKR